MTLDNLVYDHRKLMWINERRRFLTPSPASPALPDEARQLSLPLAMEHLGEDMNYVDDLMRVHRHDLEEVLTTEEWRILQTSLDRSRASFAEAREIFDGGPAEDGERLGQLLIDTATVAEIDGFINGLIYSSVRELNLSPTGPQAAVLEYARGDVTGADPIPCLPEPAGT